MSVGMTFASEVTLHSCHDDLLSVFVNTDVVTCTRNEHSVG